MISILMPIYNGIEFINDSVSSIIEQTFTDWELIVGINGHPKNSDVYKKALEYKKENKIIVLDMENIKGKSNALNEMLKYCKYDHIAILDVDDIWLKNKLELQVPFIEKYDIVGTRCIYFGERLNGIIPYIPLGDLSNFNFLSVNPIINSSVIIKKKYCYWIEKFDGVEDYELWLRLKKNKCSFYNIEKILVKHRLHKNSAFNNTNNNIVNSIRIHYS